MAPAASDPKPAPPQGRAPRRRGPRALLWLALALALVVGAVAASAWWALRTERGTAWLLSQVPGVQITEPRGRLIGGFFAKRVEILLPGEAASAPASGGADRIVLTDLRWRGLSLRLPSSWRGRLGLHIEVLSAARVDIVRTPRPDTGPATPPASLRLPIEIEIDALLAGEVHAAPLGERPLRDVRAHLHLGDEAGARHRIRDFGLSWDEIHLRGDLSIGSQRPFDVDAQVQVTPGSSADGTPLAGLDMRATASGPLDTLEVTAALRGEAPGGPPAKAPSLDATATVQPFAPWPLGALDAQLADLDLSALLSGAPRTLLSGKARVETDGMSRPATATLELINERAGRFSQASLPIRSLNVAIQGRPDTPDRFELRDIDARLGTDDGAAGRVQGTGRWTPERAELDATVSDLRPGLLHDGAPEMELAGKARLRAEGLIAPPGDAKPPARKPRFELAGRLAGTLRWATRQQPVQLEFDARGDEQAVELRRAFAQAGPSRANVTGNARLDGTVWRVRGKGSLAQFDPSAWWPGAPGSAWRRGPHRLNGSLDVDVGVAKDIASRTSAAARAAAVRGRASVALSDSILAGTSLAGEAALRTESGGTAALTAGVDVAGSRIQVEGRFDTGPRGGASDHWELEAPGIDLARLAPLLQLALPPGGETPSIAGTADLSASVDGRWPAVRTRGSAALSRGRLDAVRLAKGGLRWDLGTAESSRLELQGEVAQLSVAGESGAQRLDSARVSVSGTAENHSLKVSLSSPVKPPQWVDMLQDGRPADASAPTGTLAELAAQGALLYGRPPREPGRNPETSASRPIGWKGTLQQLELRGRDSRAAPWLRVADVSVEAAVDPSTSAPRVELSSGRAQLPGAALRWTQARWQGGASPALTVQAELEPIAVAPLLARVQPSFGWGGDLVVAGRVDIRSAPTFDAEVVVERQAGDLTVTDEGGSPLSLGLTDLRLAMEAHDGLWYFTQALAGKTLGAIAGAVGVRTSPQAMWPADDAPISGVLEARVANLGAWGAWVPAGWRLAGALHASATIGGRFGAPQYVGQVDGNGLGMRNLLQGIELRDGDLAIALQGETARIDKLQARAGDGTVSVDGTIAFGADPQANLTLVAEHMLALGRVDRRIVASGRASLELRADSIELEGKFTVDEGVIDFSRGDAPTLGDDVVVVGSEQEDVEAGSQGGLKRNVSMNVQLDMGEDLRLRGRGLDTQLRGELTITAPGGRVAVNGTIRTHSGSYAAYRQNLKIERGVIAFTGPVEDPRLDILAVRPDVDVRVGVAITGTALNPRIRLFSEPAMSDTDKLSWLVLGRASDGLGRTDTALLQSAALALLAGEGGGPGDGFSKRLGLDELSVSQSDGEVRETIVSLGKQVSRRWYVGYERSLNTTTGTWQLIYRIAQRFTLRAQSGLDNSLDLIWTWRWQ